MPHDSAAGAAPAAVKHKNHFRWVPAAVREETEAWRGGQTSQGHRARPGPDPQAVCQSLPSPFLATGDLVERDMGSPPGAPVRGRKRPHSPSSAPGSSQKRCLATLEGRALFSLPSTPRGGAQQAAWLCRIYLSTRELKELAHSGPAPGS